MLDVCKNRFMGGINWNSKVDVSVNLVEICLTVYFSYGNMISCKKYVILTL